MGNVYIGNSNGKASKVTGAFIGINNVARKIKNIYIGDENNVARLIWTDKTKYLMLGYQGNSYASYPRELFSAYDRKDNTTFLKRTTTDTSWYTTSTSSTKISRKDGVMVACRNPNKSRTVIDVFKQTSSNYTLMFSIGNTAFTEYVPNSGDTAFIHKVKNNNLIIGNDSFGFSADGKYFYVAVSGVYTEENTNKFNACMVIFNISSGSPVYHNSFNFYNFQVGSGGALQSIEVSASDDLSVFAVRFYYNKTTGSTGTGYYTYYACVGDVSSSYTKNSLPYYRYGSSESYSEIFNLNVSPDGNYLIYKCEVPNPNGYVYNNQMMYCSKVDKTNKTVTGVGALGATYTNDLFTGSLKYCGFIENDYFYSIVASSRTADSGTLDLKIYKLTDGKYIRTTAYALTNPVSGSTFLSYNSNLVCPLDAITFDFTNNIMLMCYNKTNTCICTLNGSEGTYTGYTYVSNLTLATNATVGQFYLS